MNILLRLRLVLALGLVVSLLALTQNAVKARPADQPPPPAARLHPTFPVLDDQGASVLVSARPVSTERTCGACHDTAFIQSHSYHATLGQDKLTASGPVPGGRPWDTNSGAFGRWDPLRYRTLSAPGDPLLDMGIADWIATFGDRHVGGGPALRSRDGRPLTELPPDPANPATARLDPTTGQPTAWDWRASGGVEMNCFLCHTPNPNNEARITALEQGQFRWANTATLAGSGLVTAEGNGYRWNPAAFDADGRLKPEFVTLQAPTNANCGQCHGLVHTDAKTPVSLADPPSVPWNTLTTGQIIAGQMVSASGLNLTHKAEQTRPWDVHAARQVQCVNCHFSLNNPVYYQEQAATRPDHVAFDPRRLSLGEYLQRPSHDFATAPSAQHALAPELADTMRRCEGCHDAAATHNWLPYTERHLNALACETCHVPQLYAPALQAIDWTVLTPQGEPRREYRGVNGDPQSAASLVEGFRPALLFREDADGQERLAPHNLITAWYWVYNDPPRPVRLLDLQAAWFDGQTYAPEALAALDANQDGTLGDEELVLDTPAKQSVIAARLASRGLKNPRISGDVQPYTVSHDVVGGKWATASCITCHGPASRLAEPVTLAGAGPSGVTPTLVGGANTRQGGNVTRDAQGALRYQQNLAQSGLYVFGHSNVSWVDWLGVSLLLAVTLGVVTHGGLRVYSSLRQPRHTPQLRRVYMYTVYERLWHWLQTFAILGLVFTGLIIHKPALFGMFAFGSVVQVHNVLAVIVILDAGLSLFYHLASGEVRQFIPQPRGLPRRALAQTRYYLSGIFKNEPHPFAKTPQRKLNPLQQITYFGLLNVLLPAQIITGALIWGAQRWPSGAERLGGLTLLAPFHAMIAWLLTSFVVLHVYLTTTGHTPLASIQAMMLGWDEVEAQSAPTPPDSRGAAGIEPRSGDIAP